MINRCVYSRGSPLHAIRPLAVLAALALVLLIPSSAYAADGDLDTTFSGDGKVTQSVGTSDHGRAVALLPDGKILVAGGAYTGATYQYDFAVARFNADGSLDTSFGTNGIVTIPVSSGYDEAYGMAVTQAGQIILAGYADIPGEAYNFAVVRLHANGSRDTSFGELGVKEIDFYGSYDVAEDVVVQPDGKIVVVGYAYNTPFSDFDFAYIRLNTNGSLDTTFHADGKGSWHFGGHDYGYAVDLQPDGKIVIAGLAETTTGDDNFGLLRLNTDGYADSTFGTNAEVSTDMAGLNLGDGAYDVLVLPDGRIVAVGWADLGATWGEAFAAARYTSTGALDTSFSSDGKTWRSWEEDPSGDERATAVVRQRDNKLVLAGYASNGSNMDFALTRMNEDGSPDTSFGPMGDGEIITSLWFDDYAYDAVVQPDGRIILAGNTAIVYTDFALARYQTSFTANPDTTGVFRPSNGWIYLKNQNTSGFADQFQIYGIANDKPVAGDWDGDGIDSIGVYRNGSFYLRNDPGACEVNCFADVIFATGRTTGLPVAGDWDADGFDEVGIYYNGTFNLILSETDISSTLPAFGLGIPGDLPIAGDWNGDGIDTVGVFRPSNGWIYLKNSNTTGFADQFQIYGIANDLPLAGDWDGDGIDSIGVLRGNWFYLRNDPSACTVNCFADVLFQLGIAGDLPIAGDWDGLP